jgi:hypothetical protein
MAGLYRRGVQRAAGLPLGQVQASNGAGGAIPRGFAPQQEQDNSAQTTENAKTLGGLLGMMNQQKQAQQDVHPELTEAQQASDKAMNLPDPAATAFASAPSANGEWGGVQASTFGPGIPAPTGEFQFKGVDNMGLSSTPSMQGFALPNAGAGQIPGAIANVGGDFMNAGQAATGAAMNAGNAVAGAVPQANGLLDMLKNGWGAVSGFFGGGAGA